MLELHRLAGRASLYRAAPLPPLRPRRAGAALLSGMPCRGGARAVRAGGRTRVGGGDGARSGGARGADGQRSVVRPARRQAGRPPFGRLAALIVSAADAESCDFTARALSRAAPQLPGLTVLGPAPAPLAVLRGRHRRRFLVKAGREVRLQAVLGDWLS